MVEFPYCWAALVNCCCAAAAPLAVMLTEYQGRKTDTARTAEPSADSERAREGRLSTIRAALSATRKQRLRSLSRCRHCRFPARRNEELAVKRSALLVTVVLALAGAGGASAYALRTIFLAPGHCKKVHGTKVCARKAAPRTTTVTHTSTTTVTVAPSPIGRNFSGNGDSTLAPLTIPAAGVTVHWTAQPDQIGDNFFAVASSPSDA